MTQSGLEFHSEGVSVTVQRRGARVSSLRIDGREYLVSRGQNPLLWGCYPMVPWVGRLDHGRFTFAGNEYHMPVNLAPHAIHGLGLDREWEIGDDGRSLELDFLDPWPFGGSARFEADLTSTSLTLTLSVTAGQHPMPVTIGWHPVFRKRVDPDIAELSFHPGEMWERGGDGLPTGELSPVSAGTWDDCFAGVMTSPRITWSNGFSITLGSPTETWVVYDETSHALCVEPLTGIPDAFNQPGGRILDPGETVLLPFTITWGQQDCTRMSSESPPVHRS